MGITAQTATEAISEADKILVPIKYNFSDMTIPSVMSLYKVWSELI